MRINIKVIKYALISQAATESACNAGDPDSIPGLGRYPREVSVHSSVLAWRIPWTEEPGGLQSIGSQRDGLDRATNTYTTEG